MDKKRIFSLALIIGSLWSIHMAWRMLSNPIPELLWEGDPGAAMLAKPAAVVWGLMAIFVLVVSVSMFLDSH